MSVSANSEVNSRSRAKDSLIINWQGTEKEENNGDKKAHLQSKVINHTAVPLGNIHVVSSALSASSMAVWHIEEASQFDLYRNNKICNR